MSSIQTGARTPMVRAERAVELGRDPAVLPARDLDDADLEVLRVGRRVVGADEGDAAAVRRHGSVAVHARLLGERPDVPFERHEVDVLAQIAVPRVVARGRGDDSGRVGEPRDTVMLERTGGEIAGRTRAVGGDDVDVQGSVADPAFVVEAGEERLDLARRLPPLVLRLVPRVAGAAGVGEPLAVGRPGRGRRSRPASSRACAARRGRRQGAHGASTRVPSRPVWRRRRASVRRATTRARRREVRW